MNEAIEKAKEIRNKICDQCGQGIDPCDRNGCGDTADIDSLIAMLEAGKLEIGASALVESWELDHFGKYESATVVNKDLRRRVQEYAESYHAEQFKKWWEKALNAPQTNKLPPEFYPLNRGEE